MLIAILENMYTCVPSHIDPRVFVLGKRYYQMINLPVREGRILNYPAFDCLLILN